MPRSVPIYKPLLPDAKAIAPYLEQIDRNRIYANRGPLAQSLEARLAALLTGRPETVAVAASGTAALEASILAAAGRAEAARPLALLPGYTFSATAHAAMGAGYHPHFLDISPEDWQLRAADVLRNPALPRAGVVIPVAPFGARPLLEEWTAFHAQSGIPVVIDAAASFEAAASAPAAGDIPVALSFHATKSFSTGEGGAVLWRRREGLMRVVQALNFGMILTRESRSAGFNGKLSEYHAAIGLAGLDRLAAARNARADTLARYRRSAAAHGIAQHLILHPEIAPCYALFRAPSPAMARAALRALQEAGCETRFWYGFGVHAEPYFRSLVPAGLPHTEALAARIIGIPIADDLDEESIARVTAALGAAR